MKLPLSATICKRKLLSRVTERKACSPLNTNYYVIKNSQIRPSEKTRNQLVLGTNYNLLSIREL